MNRSGEVGRFCNGPSIFADRLRQAFVISASEVNPYDPPSESLDNTSDVAGTVRDRRGPALYIVIGALVGGFASLPFLAVRSPLAFVTILVGCVSGGLLYRSVSSGWPVDETVRRRQLIYAFIAAVLPPLVLALTANDEGQAIAYAFIGAVVGGSVACGILVSGTKRQMMDDTNGRTAD
ncbi:hypothetical protein Mal15_32880 [Stieleria maiorica]|uniref:Uncharacterized protein n=1 Tax=Stieleria maiorica TaxID=2795974 RepID=A0A5B9MGJ5_9BACT|nr:hypothetical protein [Stieleria maiorica]QEF99226.1 hypothetical protein Mal15_32880 [Stieleria maiorica]